MSNAFIPTLDLLAKLKTFLAALELTPADGPTPAVPLFQKVEFYAVPNFLKALEDLRLFKSRVCLIVPSGDEFETRFTGPTMECDANRDFEILIADRDYGRRQNASTGDSDTPGVVKMKDLVIEKLFGQALDFPPRLVRLRPVSGQALVLTDKERDNAGGREAWQTTWLADAGTMIQ